MAKVVACARQLLRFDAFRKRAAKTASEMQRSFDSAVYSQANNPVALRMTGKFIVPSILEESEQPTHTTFKSH
jgi:hypothetical protein